MNEPPLYFYGGPFSNFIGGPITVNGRVYTTVEHFFQATKATNNDDHEYVRCADAPWRAKARGRNIRLRDDWEEIKYDVMLNGLRAKFALDLYREHLLSTGEREIREDSPTDFIWGYRNGGQNLLGKALMQVRAELLVASPD